MSGLVYIGLSVACSTAIFLFFALFKKHNVNNLQAIVANYTMAGLLGWLPFFSNAENDVTIDSWSWWPILIGIFFITLFQLMARVTQESGVAVVSVTVKMSVVIPVAFGLIYLKESMSAVQFAGLIAALVSVYLINASSAKGQSMNKEAIIGPVVLFIGSGILDVLMKLVQSNVIAQGETARFTSAAFLVAAILGFIYMIIRFLIRLDQFDFKSWLWGWALGIPNFGSIYFLINALDSQWPSSVLFPMNNVGIVAASAGVSYFLLKEKLSGRKRLGLLLAFFAIALLAA